MFSIISITGFITFISTIISISSASSSGDGRPAWRADNPAHWDGHQVNCSSLSSFFLCTLIMVIIIVITIVIIITTQIGEWWVSEPAGDSSAAPGTNSGQWGLPSHVGPCLVIVMRMIIRGQWWYCFQYGLDVFNVFYNGQWGSPLLWVLVLGTGQATKADEFSENIQWGGGNFQSNCRSLTKVKFSTDQVRLH